MFLDPQRGTFVLLSGKRCHVGQEIVQRLSRLNPSSCLSTSLQVPCPTDQQEILGAKTLQFTLVDCPGHASLVKTVLIGAQIIDMTLLVIDATKGIQTQTGECIILSELLSNSTVVALNKIDLFPDDTRKKCCRKVGRAVLEALKLTRIANSDLVPVTTKNGAAECIDALKDALVRNIPNMIRRIDLPFLFMADHCFQVKGHGTVLSGAQSSDAVIKDASQNSLK
jgi:selenocysteine-specific elongation factor